MIWLDVYCMSIRMKDGWMDRCVDCLLLLTVLLFIVVVCDCVAALKPFASELVGRGSIVVEPPLPSTF